MPDAPVSKKWARGMGSRSGTMNRCDGGGSDDEIAKLTPAACEAAQLKLSEVKDEAATSTLTEDDKIRVVEWQLPMRSSGLVCALNNLFIG